MTLRLVTKDKRTRSSEQIARDLNRQLPGIIPGVIITTRASGGNQQQNRLFGGGDSPHLARDSGRRPGGLPARRAGRQGGDGPRPRDPQRPRRPRRRPARARDSGRPARRRRSSACRSPAWPTRSARASAARRRRSSASRGNEYPIIVRLREEDRGRVEDISDILLSTRAGPGHRGEEPHDRRATSRARPRSSARIRSASSA